jgi:hypothetical protein
MLESAPTDDVIPTHLPFHSWNAFLTLLGRFVTTSQLRFRHRDLARDHIQTWHCSLYLAFTIAGVKQDVFARAAGALPGTFACTL